MKISIGENDICKTCVYKNPLRFSLAGYRLKENDCLAGIDDIFLDDTVNISDCKCYKRKSKTKKADVVIPDEIVSAYREFKEMRQKIKAPLTAQAERRLFNRLNELAPNNYVLQNEMLFNAVDNCWKTVYLPNNLKSKDKLQSKPSYDLEKIKRNAMFNTEIE